MTRRRITTAEAFAAIEAMQERPTRRLLANSLSCSVGQAHELLRAWERRADRSRPHDDVHRPNFALLFPLPRWCQPQRQRPRYRIDDHFPADRDLTV